jgi:hypothetical protein
MLPSPRFIVSVLLPVLLLPIAGQAANLKVNCNNKTEEGLSTINGALKLLNPEGPNTVTVFGSCHENVVIQSFDRLTLIASSGASINDASGGSAVVIDIADSRRISIQDFTINGGADGVDCHDFSLCRFHGNAIQGSLSEGVSVRDSEATFDGDVLQNHGDNGLGLLFGANVSLNNVTLQHNANGGVSVGNSVLSMFSGNIVQNNGGDGVFVGATSRLWVFGATIAGNGGNGVLIASGSTAGFSNVVITRNGGPGVSLGNIAFARFEPGITVSGNLTSPDVLCFGKFPATAGARTNLGGGTTNCTEP